MTKQLKTDFKIFQDGIPITVSYAEIVDYYQKNGQSTNDIDPSQYPMVIEFTFGDIFIQSTHALKGKNEVFRYVYLGQINYDEAGNVLPSSLREAQSSSLNFQRTQAMDAQSYPAILLPLPAPRAF